MSDGNTEGTPFQGDSVETIRQRLLQTTKAYLLGAIHDATERKTTFRLSQKYKSYPLIVKKLLACVGQKAWIYKEGKRRKVYIVEFSKSFLDQARVKSKEDKKYYLRGYFDTEGGIARDGRVRPYIYLAQKNRSDLQRARRWLVDLGIDCGIIHNPSKKVDPNYWRFFVRARSYHDFAQTIGSWHPTKSSLLRKMI